MEEQVKDENTQQQWHHVINLEDMGGLKRKLCVTYDATAVHMAFDKASQSIGKRVVINGFRQGKAPRNMVEKFCAKEIETAAASMLSQEGYLHGIYEHKFVPLSEPKVENSKFNIDGTFSCEIMIDVRPTIVPSGYIGLRLNKPELDAQQNVSTTIKELRTRFSKFEERQEILPGMTVVVDYKVVVNNQEIMSHQGVPFVVNEKGEIPLGNVQIFGHKIDDFVVSHFTLPNDFKDYGGQEADVNVQIKKVLESIPPTDEELAVRNGFVSFDELGKSVQQQVNMEIGQQTRKILEEQVIDSLLETHQFEVPEDWTEKESQYFTKQLGITGVPNDETSQAIHQLAERNVKRSFMLDSIYEAEPTLRVKNEEIEILLEQEATKQGMSKAHLKRMLLKQGMMDSVVELVKSKKIMDFLISNAEIVSKNQTVGSELGG